MAEQRKLSLILDLVDNVSGKLTPLGRQLESTGKKMESVGKNLTLFATGPLALAGASFVKAAADAEETANRFDQVFGDLADSSREFADELGEAVGRSTVKIQDGLSTFQSFAVGMGFGRQEAQKMSQTLQALSLDFASFNNISDDEAMQRFISALSGSAEVLDRFGINVKASALDLELQSQGLANSTMEATEQEKAIARLAIIMRAMTDQGAVGDAIRTQDSFTNQMKRLNDAFLDLRVQLGQDIIPALAKLVSALGDGIEWFNGLSETTRKVILIFATFVATLGPVVFIVGKLISAFVALRTALVAARIATLALLGPWGLAIAAASALAAVVGFSLFSSTEDATASTGDLEAQIAELTPQMDDLTGISQNLAGGIASVGKEAAESAKKIQELKDKAKDVFDQMMEDEAGSKRQLAEAVIEQEEHVAELRKQIKELERTEETREDAKRLRAMQQQLEEEEAALKNAGFIRKNFSAEVAEAERRASLTAFERKIEDIQRARKARAEDHILRLQEIAEEIRVEDEKNAKIQASWAAAQAAMRKEMQETTIEFKIQATEQKDAVDSVIESFNQLSRTANSTPAVFGGGRAAGGPVSRGTTYLVGEKGPELFTPNTGGTIIPNGRSGGVTVIQYVQGSVVTERELMEKAQRGMADGIKKRIRV